MKNAAGVFLTGKRLAIVIVALFLISGLAVYGYQTYMLYKNVKVVKVEPIGFNVEGWPLPSAVTITYRIIVHNPTGYSLTIEELYYEVYVEGNYLTRGYKENIYISPGDNPIDVDVRITTADALNVIANIIRKGSREIYWEIRGELTVPIKLFGILRITSIDVPYKVEGVYTVIPSEAWKERIEAHWERTEITLGEMAQATVIIHGPFRGYVTVQIRKDLALQPDEVVYDEDMGLVDVGYGEKEVFYVTFQPPEASSLTLRGYYIAVIVDGYEWIQESNYPPRLKVYKTYKTTPPYTSPSPSPPPPSGYLVIERAYWLVNGYPAFNTDYGDIVEAIVEIRAEAGTVSGVVTIIVKKDKRGLPDEKLLTESFYVNLASGQKTTLSIEFIVTDKPSFFLRGYFIEIYLDGERLYTMPSEYPPRLKLGS